MSKSIKYVVREFDVGSSSGHTLRNETEYGDVESAIAHHESWVLSGGGRGDWKYLDVVVKYHVSNL